jgi:Mn-dependent DtxR family transcriptional regulator
MNWSAISDEIRRFILINIPSIPYLETMLLMRKDAEHQWDADQIAKRLFIDNKAATLLLLQLQVAGIITIVNKQSAAYQYGPKSADLMKTIDQLAETYSANLIEVTNLIHSNINKKAHKFADAFLWRKKDS